MRFDRTNIVLVLLIFFAFALQNLARAQSPAPVENVSSFPPRSPQEERKALHVPPGFEIQLVAAEPDIHKPLNLAFDDRGRLWVTEHRRVSLPGPRRNPAPRHGQDPLRLSGRRPGPQDHDLRRRPEHPDRRLAAAIGHARRSSTTSRTSTGCATPTATAGPTPARSLYGVFGNRDTHGMTNAFTWGFDGWVYACHGFSNDSTGAGEDHRPISMNSGNTYRMRPDGSHVEYFTHGQVNPFGLAFDPLGNLYSCDCHSRPIYQLLRGA